MNLLDATARTSDDPERKTIGHMRYRRVFLRFSIATTFIALSLPSLAWASDTQEEAGIAQCEALRKADFTGIQDAPTQVRDAKMVAGSEHSSPYCRLTAYVAPQVGLEVRLPSSNWNGKVIVVGNIGWGGEINGDDCDPYLMRGYACIASDTGHEGRGDDGLWARQNLQAQVDFGFRAVHVATLAGKAIMKRYYSKGPQHSYFVGCSTGGYEGLVEAQRFPWDFDGVIAGAPDMDEADLTMRQLWAARNYLDVRGRPALAIPDIQYLHTAVLEKCDRDDGLADGIISNPMACQFDPDRLLCKTGVKKNCFTRAQVEVIKRIYAGPLTAMQVGTPVRGALPGSELDWNDKFRGLGAVGPPAADALFKHMIYGANPDWGSENFDFEHDFRRLGMAALYTDTNPDLRKFKAAGGKLLIYQGWSDTVEMPTAVVDYYQTVERTIGSRASTQDFFRLFMVPGMGHCGGGKGAFSIDYLSYLEAWVERHQAPDLLVGAHISEAYLAALPIADDESDMTPELHLLLAALSVRFPLDPAIPITFTRPVFPYPIYPRYTGFGDPNDALNFAPVNDIGEPR